jgi:hypothetical protein
MFGTGAIPGADRFLDRRRVGRASGHIARSRPTGAGRGRSGCTLYHHPRPVAIHPSQGRSGGGRTPADEAGSRPMSRREDAPRDLLFGLIARNDPESIAFSVVGPTQVNTTRRNQPRQTRGKRGLRDSSRSHRALVQALDLDSVPGKPIGRPDQRCCRPRSGRSDLAATRFGPPSPFRPSLRAAVMVRPAEVPVDSLASTS